MAKNFNSPLMQFITPTQNTTPTPAPVDNPAPQEEKTERQKKTAAINATYKAPAPAPFRAIKDHSEPRSRRVQLLLRPSLHAAALEMATAKKQSINNFIEEALLAYIENGGGQ